jgi:hypothetical protein
MRYGPLSGPAESEYDHCNNGCGGVIDHSEQSCECHAKACGKDNLCSGCTCVCTGACGDDFCEEHVLDIAAEDATESVWICRTCLRNRIAATTPAHLKGEVAA